MFTEFRKLGKFSLLTDEGDKEPNLHLVRATSRVAVQSLKWGLLKVHDQPYY